MVLILLGNFARSASVKFEVFEIISLKIGSGGGTAIYGLYRYVPL